METLSGDVRTVMRGLLDRSDRDCIVSVPSVSSLRVSVDLVGPHDRILVSDDARESLESPSVDLALASALQELMDAGVEVRTGDAPRWVVSSPDHVGYVADGICGGDDTLWAASVDRWGRAKGLTPDAPSLSSTLGRLRDTLGSAAAETYCEVHSVLCRSSGLDAAATLVWCGARSESLLGDVREVAEELGLCSTTTVSRRCQTLCDLGVIETERVSLQRVGEPPKRLTTRCEMRGSSLPNPLLDALSWV